MKKNILKPFLFLFLFISLIGCKDAIEEHIEVTNVDNTISLIEKIASRTDLSKFNEFLKATGYDKLLASSQSYTVWAPTNTALNALDAAIIADPIKLKDFVANHIALTSIPASKGVLDTIKVNLQNGKFANVVGSSFEEAAIIGAGNYVKNGALFTIDKAILTKKNVWDYMLESTDATLQTTFIKNLTALVIDTANATVIGYNTLGNPIFAPNPPLVSRNSYWNAVADLRREDLKFTFFMLENPAYDSEVTKLLPYFANGSQFAVVRDLTVRGLYTEDKLPATLLSTRGVKIPINKANIVKSYRASNGMVYVLKALPIPLSEKIPVVKIEGEQPIAFRTNRSGNTYYRTKLDNLLVEYKDIEVYNHGVSEFYIEYWKTSLPVIKYKVYSRVIAGNTGDSQVAGFTQRYFIYNPLTLTYELFATQAVTPLNFNEVLLGEFTPKEFGTLQLRLTAAASTSVNVNTLILDYLRFEPVLP